jgi:hypothetical protein
MVVPQITAIHLRDSEFQNSLEIPSLEVHQKTTKQDALAIRNSIPGQRDTSARVRK